MEKIATTIVVITSILAFAYLLDTVAYVIRKRKRIYKTHHKGYYPFITKEQVN